MIRQRRSAETDLHPCTDPRSHGTNSRMLSPRNSHEPTHDIPRNEQPHTPRTGEFHSSLPFSSFSSPRVVDRGFYTYKRYRYKNTLTKDNPHLFPSHHNRIEPTPSQPHRFYFLIHKSPELPSYKQNSISRYHHMYTINQSRDNLGVLLLRPAS